MSTPQGNDFPSDVGPALVKSDVEIIRKSVPRSGFSRVTDDEADGKKKCHHSKQGRSVFHIGFGTATPLAVGVRQKALVAGANPECQRGGDDFPPHAM